MIDLEKIRALREKLGLTMEQAAAAAGMSSRQQWYQLETGIHTPKVETLERVAKALHVRITDLLK